MRPLKCIVPSGSDEEGDCYRTCLAMILNVDQDFVPNFAEMVKDSDSFQDDVDEWLHQFGLRQGCALMSGEEKVGDLPMFVNNVSPGTPAIVSGTVESGQNHSVVVWNGKFYDPARNVDEGETCLVGPLPRQAESEPVWWITFISAGPNFRLTRV